MGEIIDARHLFAPVTEGQYESGQLAPPGIYVDALSGNVVTLFAEETLPEEVRIVRYPRRYVRFENREAASTYLGEHQAILRAA